MIRQVTTIVAISKMFNFILCLKRRIKNLHLMNSVLLSGNDLNVIYYLVQILENNKDNQDLVQLTLEVLLIPIILMQHPGSHALEPEKFLSILKGLNVGSYSLKIASVTKCHVENKSIQNLGRQILVGIDSVLNSNFANYHHSMGSLSAFGHDS